jgi:hypothetical protein
MAKKPTPAAKTITRDDWLTAIEETRAHQADQDPGLVSYYEFAALMGITYGTAMKRLKELVAAGRAVRTTKRTVIANGRCLNVVAFRLKKP